MTDERSGATDWNLLPAEQREAALALLAQQMSDGERAAQRAELRRATLERLLDSDRRLALALAGASAASRGRLEALLERLSSQLVPALSAGPSPHLTAYGRQLYRQVVELGNGVSDGAGLGRLLTLAHRHPLIGPHARSLAIADLVDQLLVLSGDDLREKVSDMLATSTAGSVASTPDPGWLRRPQRLLLSVDHTAYTCGRYLAGVEEPGRDPHGFDELKPAPTGRTKRIDEVAVKFEPPAALEDVPPAPSPPGELKAKLLVALLSLAAEHRREPRSAFPRVPLKTLLELLGFRLGRTTNSRYYWNYAAQVARHLLVDLPNRIVAMQATMVRSSEPLLVFERLLVRARALDGQGRLIDRSALLAGSGALRTSGVHGFEFGFSEEFLQALGLIDSTAVEHMPTEVLSLRGPAFWLAWQIAFLRRWAGMPRTGAQGKPLLRILEEAGYLAANRRDGRVRYKDALRQCWRDVGELVNLGVLDEPGLRLYRPGSSRWRDVSGEMSRCLDRNGEKLTGGSMEGVRAVFQLPAERLNQLDGARRRGRSAESGRSGSL